MGLADALISRIDKCIKDRLDAAISSRLAAADYTAPDNAGVGNIKAKTDLIPASGPASAAYYTQARAAALDLLDAAISLVKAKTDLIPSAGPPSATDYTATRAGKLDNLDHLNADISSRASATDYTATRAAKLDNLDAAISGRLAGSAYKDPDTTALSASPTAGALTDLIRVLEKRALSSPVANSLGAKVNSVPTDVWAAATRTLTSAPSAIKSIQTGYAGAPSSSGSGEDTKYTDITISSVDTSKSFVLMVSHLTQSGSSYFMTGRLISSTTLRVSLASTASVSGGVRWYVIEFA